MSEDAQTPLTPELYMDLFNRHKALRDENARLRANLINCAARLEAYYGEDYPAVRDAKNVLDGGKGVQGG